MGRKRWDSRLAFILAAVGSAAGLGKIWRFPYLAGKYGAGGFIFPYLIALFVLGVPLLMLEFSVGQKMQQGAIGSFEKLHSKFGGLGIFALISSFILVAYYAVVIAWSFIYTLVSPKVGWSGDAQGYFFNNILEVSEGIGVLGGINWEIFAALVAVWIIVYFCIWKGPDSVGKVVKWTVPIPILLLLIFLIRTVTLPGFLQGWELYLTPVWSALLDPEVWIQAIAQVFFTLSLAFGVMVAYSSYKDEKADVTKDSWITAIVNSCISLLSGFVVFGILGYMAYQTGTPLKELAGESGVGLAFVVFPKAIELMPLAGLFGFLFFVILLTLGVDSAFSLVEAVNAGVQDKTDRWHAAQVAFIVGVIAFILGIIFTTRAGIHILDVVDHFITTYNIVLVGFLETIMVGWYYGAEKMRKVINKVSDWHLGKWWNYSIKWVAPIGLGFLLIINFIKEVPSLHKWFLANLPWTSALVGESVGVYGGYPSWAIGIGWGVVVVPLLFFLYFFFTKKPEAEVVES